MPIQLINRGCSSAYSNSTNLPSFAEMSSLVLMKKTCPPPDFCLSPSRSWQVTCLAVVISYLNLAVVQRCLVNVVSNKLLSGQSLTNRSDKIPRTATNETTKLQILCFSPYLWHSPACSSTHVFLPPDVSLKRVDRFEDRFWVRSSSHGLEVGSVQSSQFFRLHVGREPDQL